MKTSALKTEILAAFLIGTSRRRPDFAGIIGAANDPKADLKAAALLAQALRLERPVAPPHIAVAAAPAGRRRPIPEELRAPFLRLFGSDKRAVTPQDDLAQGMAFALERLFLSPHPYDFHRLDGFLRAHAERLGADVQAWLARDTAGAAPGNYFELAVLADDTWSEATPARRQRYIIDRRHADPAAARALVEACWSNEAADIRLRLLSALRVGLSVDDRPFLEGLAKDRAPKVRELAGKLLDRLPGPNGERAGLSDLLSRIKRDTTGLFRKKTVLKLELPATVNHYMTDTWIGEAFRDVELDAFVAALGLDLRAAIAAAQGDKPLSIAFVHMVTRARRFDLLAELIAGAKLANEALAMDDLDFSRDEALAYADAVLQLDAGRATYSYRWDLMRIFAVTEGPVAASTFAKILIEADARGKAGEAEAASLLPPLALLAPPEFRADVRVRAQILADQGDLVVAWLDLLDSLESVPSHE